jgi:hypothetical protein
MVNIARWADLVASACACVVAAMKADQRIADGPLHRLLGSAIEGHPVIRLALDNASPPSLSAIAKSIQALLV